MTADRRGRFHPSPRIRFAHVDGIIVILDFATQKYFALDERATSIWDAVTVRPPKLTSEEVESLASAEVKSFIGECLNRGVLVVDTPNPVSGLPPSLETRHPSVLALAGLWTVFAIGCLHRAARRLRRYGFAHTYSVHESLYAKVVSFRPATQIDRALEAFYRAESVVPMPNSPDDCLPRSFALFSYLRALGFACQHFIGVRRYPSLTMHAWVEVDGHVVADRAVSKEFVTLTTIGGSSQNGQVQ